jgi:DNA-binding transcriptional LysR family regulator
MQMTTLKIFCDLVDSESFTEAAERNGVTQSAVSQQMRALEKHYGVTLVERGRKNFAVTAEGEVFLAAARDILDRFNGIESELGEMRDRVAGPLRVATVYSIGFHELPPYLDRYRASFPDVELKVQYRRANQIYADVLESRADIGLVAYPQARKGIEVEKVWEDRLVLVCPPGHELSREKRQRVGVRALDGLRFISFEPDLPTRKAIDAMFREAGVQVKEVVEFDNIETVKRGVVIENAVSLVPSDSVRDEVEAGSLCQIELDDADVTRPLGVLRRRTKAVTPAMRELIAVLQDPQMSQS